MLKIIEEIRQQPLHIRQLFMWTMVVITFSLVGVLWFKKTKTEFIALLKPENSQTQTVVAEEKEQKTESPFAVIKNSLSEMRASIYDLIGIDEDTELTAQPTASVLPQRLP